MLVRLIIFVAATLLLIAFDWYRHKNLKKSVLATISFIWLLSLAFAGVVIRPILPLFVLHFVFVMFAWLALLWYLFKDRFFWWIFMFPAMTLALFVLLSFIGGSRYEG